MSIVCGEARGQEVSPPMATMGDEGKAESSWFGGGTASLERVKGIEPSPQAWEARILPLNHTRTTVESIALRPLPCKQEFAPTRELNSAGSVVTREEEAAAGAVCAGS